MRPQSNNECSPVSADGLFHASAWERIPDGFRWFGDGAVVVSPQADTVTLVGDIPGITTGSRLDFDAFAAPMSSEHIQCLEVLPGDGTGSTTSAPAEGEWLFEESGFGMVDRVARMRATSPNSPPSEWGQAN